MSDFAIKFENISKQYQLGSIGTGTLSHDLKRWWTINVRREEDPYLKIGQVNEQTEKSSDGIVWALRDINLEVKEGEVLGIIGKNGAGKSTLLKILSRVTTPTTGRISARGRIASLLEVGTGFHPEMTGRENIFMNGSIMGMTKAEIRSKFDEIVDFAGVAKYIDTPVKRYSSGMTVRLGFAIAAHLEPEILVVDEVLAVGDAEFQKKAIGKMQDVSQSGGRTVLFVSHNMNAVRTLCSKGIVLKSGQVIFEGNTDDAINQYINVNTLKTDEIIKSISYLNNELKINSITINGINSNYLHLNSDDTCLQVVIEGSTESEKVLTLEVEIFDVNNNRVAFYGPGMVNGILKRHSPGNFVIDEKILIPKNLAGGIYSMDIDLTHPYVAYYMKASRCVQMEYIGYQFASGHNDYKLRGYYILDSAD